MISEYKISHQTINESKLTFYISNILVIERYKWIKQGGFESDQ